LYRQTEPIRLDAGDHVLTIEAGGSDSNYFLPVAWVTGEFAVVDGVIQALPRTAGAGALWTQGLAGFAGQVTYTTQVDIPSHASNIKMRLDTGGLYTSVTLDGHSLGERAWAPFEWTVPAELRGKRAEVKISVWTSIAPLFGDWKNPAAAWNKTFWISPPEARSNIGLLSAPKWVLFCTVWPQISPARRYHELHGGSVPSIPRNIHDVCGTLQLSRPQYYRSVGK
jgi:hypothetical protein